MPKLHIFNIPNMSFNAIRENKILVKISEFTILSALQTGFFFKEANNMKPDQTAWMWAVWSGSILFAI